MDSPNQTSNDRSVLEGVPNETDAPLEEGILVKGPSNVDEIGEGFPSRVAIALIPPPMHVDIISSRRRPPCHAPNPGPTQLADPNRFPGRETQDWDFLPEFFFF